MTKSHAAIACTTVLKRKFILLTLIDFNIHVVN